MTASMRTVPKGLDDRIRFYETHIEPWEANAEAIGLTAERIDELRAAIDEAREAFQTAQLARQAAQAATQALHQAVDRLHSGPGLGADSIDTIRLTASSTDDPRVYTLAQIEPPQNDSTRPAPGSPRRITASVQPTGRVDLRWKCEVPRGTPGTVYQIDRAVDDDFNANRFDFVGIAGERKFTDETLPAGAAQVVYRITAIRGTTRSYPGVQMLQFGVVRRPSAALKVAA